MSNPSQEPVDHLDAEGRVLSVVTRREMRERRLPHRCVYLLVFNREGDLFVHRRTATKDVYPSYWDVAVGGVLSAGESFDEGARRELLEEIGIDAPLEPLFPFRYDDARTSVQAMVYRVFHDGPFQLQPEEIVEGRFEPIETIQLRAQSEPFCPDGLLTLQKYLERHPQLQLPPRVLLGSGGFRTPERVAFLQKTVRDFFGPIDRLLFVPYALRDYDGYVRTLEEKGLNAGYRLDGIHRHADPRKAIREAPGIYVGGGNTFRLLDTIYRFGLLDEIRDRVLNGMPYLGISAGCNLAGPTIKTTNDMPITRPPSFDALNLVPFQINPHYWTGRTFLDTGSGMQEHFGETRDDRLREFHEMNTTPIVGLWEAGFLRIEKGRVHLLGTPARIFHPGEPPRDVEAGWTLNQLV